MTCSELMFFDAMPCMLPLYELLRAKLDERCPDITAKTGKTQISLRCRYVFAAVSLPWRKVRGWPKEYLLVSFGLPFRLDSPRIAASTEPYPGRFTHHVLLTQPSDLDRLLLDWLESAYRFAMEK